MTAPRRTLGESVSELVRRLGDADPDALARLRAGVGSRRARIGLDGEAVDVAFEPDGTLAVTEPAGEPDGEGASDRGTVLDLLDGRIEVEDAILDGRLEVTGAVDDVARIFAAIEILLDASPRTPALERLARAFREAAPPPAPLGRSRAAPWHPTGPDPDELALLGRLDLLP